MRAELVGISLEVTIIFFIISLAVVIFSADKFIDFSSILAGRLGVSEFIIGLTLIAFGTSIPEIFVGVQSLQNQAENLAVSAIIGSNISNIALIFGIACIGRSMMPKKKCYSSKTLYPFNTVSYFSRLCISGSKNRCVRFSFDFDGTTNIYILYIYR